MAAHIGDGGRGTAIFGYIYPDFFIDEGGTAGIHGSGIAAGKGIGVGSPAGEVLWKWSGCGL
jgi:hypothetical protein